MTITAVPITKKLFRDSGHQRPRAPRRTDVVMAVLSVWFVFGLFLDAYAHVNLTELETFFTPWHAVYYSGFTACAAWTLWAVWREVAAGRRGRAAVPMGYGLTLLALPAFAVFGCIDLVWHTVLGIESSTDILFSPSHLGLISTMVVIVTSPLRAAWSDDSLPARPSLRTLLPSVLTLAFAATMVLLFLDYGDALWYGGFDVLRSFSFVDDGEAEILAARMVITTLVLIAPLLLLARRWGVPRGAATIGYAAAALIAGLLAAFANPEILVAILVAGVGVDVLAAVLAPTSERRGAFWGFAAGAAFLTWTCYLAAASLAEGRLPAVAEFWTGAPVVMALVAWVLAVLMLPNAVKPDARPPSL